MSLILRDSEQEKLYIEKSLRNNTPIKEIAKEFDKSNAWVYKKIKKYGIEYESSKDKINKIHLGIVEIFLNSDKSLDEIGELFGCSKSNVSLVLKKEGLSVPTDRKNKNREKTILKTYGKTNVMHVEAIMDSRKQHFNDKFGGDSPFHSKEVLNKAKQTLIKTHGVDNPLKSQSVKDKVTSTNWKRYGGPAPACDSKVVKKMEDTNFKKYGVGNFRQAHLSKETVELRNDKNKYKEWLIEKHHNTQLTLAEIATLLGTEKSIISADMKQLDLEVMHFSRSKFEREIEEYISSIVSEGVTCNSREFKYELDVWIKSKNIAIEADGLYYHSFDTIPTSKQKYYHRNKTRVCIRNGIRLFHVWECEWNDPVKREIWKSIFRSNLCSNSNKTVAARKCEFKVIEDLSIVRGFYNSNHLQGFTGSAVHLGLFYNNDLVIAMSFNKVKDSPTWQLTRLASKLGYTVVGGASKLFSRFNKLYKPVEVHTFADLRYSYGKIYETLGFDKIAEIQPRYSYTDCKNLIHRRRFQKHRLEKLLGDLYDPNKTEFQNVFENTRYRVLYDAGKWKYVYKP